MQVNLRKIQPDMPRERYFAQRHAIQAQPTAGYKLGHGRIKQSFAGIVNGACGRIVRAQRRDKPCCSRLQRGFVQYVKRRAPLTNKLRGVAAAKHKVIMGGCGGEWPQMGIKVLHTCKIPCSIRFWQIRVWTWPRPDSGCLVRLVRG